jgi:hypothetical protein
MCSKARQGWSSSIIETAFLPGMSRWSTTTRPGGNVGGRRTPSSRPQGSGARTVRPNSMSGKTRSSM